MENSEQKIYDLIIIGTGPAGMTASIYASRYGVNHLIIGNMIGGMISEATSVENWPGEKEISGFALAQKIKESVEHAGQKITFDRVNHIEKRDDNLFLVQTELNGDFLAKTIIFATGTVRRKLNIAGEQEFSGKGVCYCATCDGPLYKGKDVLVVGGGNSAISGAIYLASICRKVYVAISTKEMQAVPDLQEKLKALNNVEIIFNASVTEFKGDTLLRQAVLNNGNVLEISGAFIEIGGIPAKDLLENMGVELDDNGYIISSEAQQTNIAGVWAAGDITNQSNGFRQMITAASEGAIAANSVYSYLKNIELK